MTDRSARGGLSTEDLATLLEVTRSLAAPFDLMSMLAAVTAAARQVLRAERSSVWLHDAAAGELVLEVSTDMRTYAFRSASASSARALATARCSTFRIATPIRASTSSRPPIRLPNPLQPDLAADRPRRGAGRLMQVLNRIDGTFETADQQFATRSRRNARSRCNVCR